MWDKSDEIDWGEPRQPDSMVRPQDQTIEEWLADYERADPWLKGQQEDELKGLQEESEMKVREGASIDFEPAPIGMHVARCIRVIDLGTAVDNMYGKPKHDVFIMWEIPGQMKTYTKKGENGAPDVEVIEPFTVSKYYNATLTEGSHLRTDLESWRSKPFTEDELQGFELKGILGVPCMINVIHKPNKKKQGAVNAVVTTVTPMPKIDGMTCPEQSHPTVFFSLDPDDQWDQKTFDELGQGLKARVMQSDEYKALLAQGRIQGQPAQQQATTQGYPQGGVPAQDHPNAPGQQAAPPMDDGFDDIPF